MKRLSVLASIVLIALAAGCASQTALPPEFQARPADGPYVIGAGDQLQIRVWRNEELSADEPVRPDGRITVPLIDDVMAAGLTTEELKELISTELSEFITNPDVTVIVVAARSKMAYVLGDVVRSGPVQLLTEVRILDALTQAGGFNVFADRSDILLIRHVDGVEHQFRFDYDAYVAGDAPGTNIVLLPGDQIVVHD